VADHVIVVTDCYRTSVPPPQRTADTPNGEATYRFSPCRDADVELRGDELLVNGSSYGAIQAGDRITVDHGRVLVNDVAVVARQMQGSDPAVSHPASN
jgi:hypothetical protein